MNKLAVARELVAVSKSLQGAFTDQPAPWGKETEDELEKVQTEAEAKLGRELEMVKSRYYWEPGKSTMINITLTGRPLFHHYSIGGLFGVGYRDGILTVNPQWLSERESIPSYKWGYAVDKMIQIVKQSEPIERTIDGALDKIEQKLGKKIESGIRRDIVGWCVKVAKGRLSAHSYPAPKGKDFVLFPPETSMPGQPAIAHELVAVSKLISAGLPVGETIERDALRTHRYRSSVEITDLTDAGRRGKRCRQCVVYDLDYAMNDAGGPIEDMMDALYRARTYEEAVRAVDRGVEAINSVSRYTVKKDERILRAVDVAPGGFAPVEINGEHVYIKADFDSFTVKDKDDMHNEPTCIPSVRGPQKTSVKMFYRWVTDNRNWIPRATFHEVTNSMSKAGIPYHYFCAVD
jgi:hypothetical protein